MQIIHVHFNRKLYLNPETPQTVPKSSSTASRNRLQLGELTVCHGRLNGNCRRANLKFFKEVREQNCS